MLIVLGSDDLNISGSETRKSFPVLSNVWSNIFPSKISLKIGSVSLKKLYISWLA